MACMGRMLMGQACVLARRVTVSHVYLLLLIGGSKHGLDDSCREPPPAECDGSRPPRSETVAAGGMSVHATWCASCA